MKSLALLSFLAVLWSARGYNDEEMTEAVCSIPEKYLHRFINCTIERGPVVFQKAADSIYKCIDPVYENYGKSDSVLLMGCYEDVRNHVKVKKCIREEEKSLEHPTDEDLKELREAALYCLVHG
uniref:Uncharacterized protein n=1 Tax=Isometrus maculatus TaxID=497827 RepID=A0A0U1TZD5_ISOMC|nr:hypothetical protein [Isometrus maculatus]